MRQRTARVYRAGRPLILFFAWLLGTDLGAQPPGGGKGHALEFQAGVEIVNVNVSVLNGRDHFVTDLRQQDFVVLENGVRQDAAVFAQSDLPISAALLLDMSESMRPRMAEVRSAASRLIDQLRPEDSAEVVQFSDRPKMLHSFTSDHDELLAAVRRAEPGGSTALHNTLYITLKELGALAKTEERRRRAIILLSDGEDTASMVSDDQVLEAARSCEVGIYSILIGRAGESSQRGDQARYLLSSLARESGGEAFFPVVVTDLVSLYERISQELHSQYNIGYISSDPSLDGSWRQILVMTPQHDGLQVRHRLGYYAVPAPLPKAKTSDAAAVRRVTADANSLR